MNIKIIIDKLLREPEIRVCGSEMSEELQNTADSISRALGSVLTGYADGSAVMLKNSDIITVYAESKHVYARTSEGVFELRIPVYKAELLLSDCGFVRISSSEIVNISRIIRLDTAIAGTIHIYLEGGIDTYVSRRYVKTLKDAILK